MSARIVSRAEYLQEGLFGQVFLFIFEILPYLESVNVRPDWEIYAQFYGGSARPLIPGVLELAYAVEPARRDVPLELLRHRHCSQLGNDWHALQRLWSSFFKLPSRIRHVVSDIGSLKDAMGVHYRGTDKLTTDWDSNPVSAENMISIIVDFLGRRSDLKRIFLATDDPTFPMQLRANIDCEIINFGPILFHKDPKGAATLDGAYRALLDSVLLSNCGAVLMTSSALSGFAKIFNPDLEIYRCAASKMFNDIPYFPGAYIEPYKSDSPKIAEILHGLMKGDWAGVDGVLPCFRSVRRRPIRQGIWTVIEAIIGCPV